MERKSMVAIGLAGIALAAAVIGLLRSAPTIEDHSIARGVSFQSLVASDGRSRVHIVRVDLTEPGLRVHIRPGEADRGSYRLDHVWRWAAREKLVAAINANYFTPINSLDALGVTFYPVGAEALSRQAVVSDGQPYGGGPYNAVLRFSENIRLQYRRVPRDERASYIESLEGQALTTWGRIIRDGRRGDPSMFKNAAPAERSALGWNEGTGQLWLCAFEMADATTMVETMLDQGIRNAITLDGGGSSCLTVRPRNGSKAAGSYVGGYRPVASMIGISVTSP